MISDDDFNFATNAKEFNMIRHNENNYDEYKEFQDSLAQRFSKVELDKVKRERLLALKQWDNSLASPWNTARLNTHSDRVAAQTAEKLINEYKRSAYYIQGDAGSGRTFLALAMMRKLIGAGYIVPDNIKHMSENDFLNITKSGFEYNKQVSTLLSNRNKAFIIDDVSNRPTYSTPEITLWEQFLDHCSRKGIIVIFTSKSSAVGFREKLSDTAATKLVNMVNRRIIKMSGNVANDLLEVSNEDLTDEEIQNNTLLDNKLNRLNNFTG